MEIVLQLQWRMLKRSLQTLWCEFVDAEGESFRKITLLNRHHNSSNFHQDKFSSLVISLKRVCHTTRIIYSSAIAHELAAKGKVSAIDLAAQLAKLVSAFMLNTLEDHVDTRLPKILLRNVEIQAIPNGLIQFEFQDPAIAYWLNSLIQLPIAPALPLTRHPSSVPSTSQFHKTLFTLQHAHARCCSLLRLADQEGLITLDQPNAEPNSWQLVDPVAIPWLTPDQHLQTNHLTQPQLVHQLLVTLDDLSEIGAPPTLNRDRDSSGKHKQVLQLAICLSQAFQTVHRDVQLLGDSFRCQPRDRLHAHLGLLLATQRSLQSLLQNWLRVHAPHEL